MRPRHPTLLLSLALSGALGPGCEPNKGQATAEGCTSLTCPVGTSREEARSVRSGERDVSDRLDPVDGESGGIGFALFSEGDCSFSCVAQTECPAGTWPVITQDCFTCALLDDDGQVIESECDFDDSASTGDSGAGDGADGGGGDGADGGDTGIGPPTRPGWEAVAAGANHSCGLYTGGEVRCWGDSDPPPSDSFAHLSAGRYGTCGVTTGGALRCWGVTGADDGSVRESDLLSGLPSGTFADVDVGDEGACARTADGGLTCWGSISSTLTSRVAAMSLGGEHGCLIDDEARLSCFGEDDLNQVTGAPSGRFTAVSAGGNHSCALDEDQAMYCWTADESGQSTPPDGDWLTVSAGDRFTCGIDVDQAMSCWGRDTAGQASPSITAPVFAVSAGHDHGCAALWDGTLACWGADGAGQASPPTAP